MLHVVIHNCGRIIYNNRNESIADLIIPLFSLHSTTHHIHSPPLAPTSTDHLHHLHHPNTSHSNNTNQKRTNQRWHRIIDVAILNYQNLLILYLRHLSFYLCSGHDTDSRSSIYVSQATAAMVRQSAIILLSLWCCLT